MWDSQEAVAPKLCGRAHSFSALMSLLYTEMTGSTLVLKLTSILVIGVQHRGSISISDSQEAVAPKLCGRTHSVTFSALMLLRCTKMTGRARLHITVEIDINPSDRDPASSLYLILRFSRSSRAQVVQVRTPCYVLDNSVTPVLLHRNVWPRGDTRCMQ